MDNLELFFGDDLVPQIDLDSFFLNGIPEAATEELFDGNAVSSSQSPSDSMGTWIDEIEKLLMKDDENGAVEGGNRQEEICESFLADLIVDSPVEGGSESGEVVDASSCDDKEADSPAEEKVADGRGGDDDEDCGVEEAEAAGDGDADEDDPVSKRKRRQLRNRDAAARSRERKKVLVKELEMKSKYLEAECLRLGRLLQCVVAENQALRMSLQNGSAYGASMTKQESAVLLLESLLLGSLLWSLGIMCLFNLPMSIQSVQDIALLENVGRREPESLPRPRGARSEKLQRLISESFLMSRKCKASRTKIRRNLLVAQVL